MNVQHRTSNVQCWMIKIIEEPRSKLREMFCRTAEPTGNALAVAVQYRFVFAYFQSFWCFGYGNVPDLNNWPAICFFIFQVQNSMLDVRCSMFIRFQGLNNYRVLYEKSVWFSVGQAWDFNELRYSALEVKNYIFGLKCLAHFPLKLVKHRRWARKPCK